MHTVGFVVLTVIRLIGCISDSGLKFSSENSGSAHRGQLVKASKQFVQRHDQLLCRALRRQTGETLYVCEEYATERKKEKKDIT